MGRTERVNARLTKDDKGKLDRYLKSHRMTVTQWIEQRIKLMRLK